MMETMAQAQMADMRRQAARLSTGRRLRATGQRETSSVRTGVGREAAARRAVGWFLVSVGLRLALPRGRSVPAV
jgi:hypothetical protein